MKIKLKAKTFCVFGLRGTGKSTFVNNLAASYLPALIYDTLGEVPEQAAYNSYKPQDRYSVGELEVVVKNVINSRNFRLFVIDEANRFCPSKPAPLPPMIADLNDQCRHYGITAGYVARRPTQLNQDLTELAEYLFVFHLKGRNDINYLNAISNGLGDAVLHLPNYHFLIVFPDRSYKVFSPITPDKQWLDRAIEHLKGK